MPPLTRYDTAPACKGARAAAYCESTSGAARESGPGNLGGHPKVPVLPKGAGRRCGPSHRGNEVSGAAAPRSPGVFERVDMPIETPAESTRGAISPADRAKDDPDHRLWRNGRLWW